MSYFKSIAVIIVAASALLAGPAIAQTPPLPAPLVYPEPGTQFNTTISQILFDHVDGVNAVITERRSGTRLNVHALFINGPAVNANLKYDRAKMESLWPLEVGKEIVFDLDRDLQVWNTRFKVLRAETITVPAGTFFTYVIEEQTRGISRNVFIGTKTSWYAPEIRFLVRSDQVRLNQNSTQRWELVKVEKPAAR